MKERTMPDMNCINLEGLSDFDLAEHEAVFFLLAGFCSKTRLARSARRTGMIPKAMILEQEAQRQYNMLPSNLKW